MVNIAWGILISQATQGLLFPYIAAWYYLEWAWATHRKKDLGYGTTLVAKSFD